MPYAVWWKVKPIDGRKHSDPEQGFGQLRRRLVAAPATPYDPPIPSVSDLATPVSLVANGDLAGEADDIHVPGLGGALGNPGGTFANTPPLGHHPELPLQSLAEPVPTRPLPVARTLDGLRVEPEAIEDTFALWVLLRSRLSSTLSFVLRRLIDASRYFRQFSPLLPVLDAKIHPDSYYRSSSFLFWVIVATGARRYSKDPTLCTGVATRVAKTMFQCLSAPTPTIQAIQAIMLLSSWPLPKRKSSYKNSFALSGILVHMAMQIGLHNASLSQDYEKVTIQLSDVEIRRREELWSYCKLSYQRYLLNSFGNEDAIYRKAADHIPGHLSLLAICH
jgi:hypothetical protein